MTAVKSVIATFNGTGSNCQSTISVGSPVSGSWAAGCNSTQRTKSYAKFYTFTLTAPQFVGITLTSTTADAYLYLHNGSGATGTVLTEDDDSGGGNNAGITKVLGAGTYTIEATTYFQSESGAFSLRMLILDDPIRPI
jgi:hypothetical protein